MMDAFETFDASAEKLLLTQNVKATELIKRLVSITKVASKDLPPVQVLYCGSYGGFGYSHEFCKFIIETGFDTIGIEREPQPESNSESEVDSCVHDEKRFFADTIGVASALARKSNSNSEVDTRVRDVELLAPFGQYVMAKWPQIAKLVKAYTRNDLGDQMHSIYMIQSNEKRLLKIPNIRDKIVAQPGKSDGETEWSTWDLDENEDYSKYAPSALEEMCTKLDCEEIELPIDILKRRGELPMTEAQYKAMFEFLKQEEVEAAQLAEKPWYERESKKEKFSFTDAITHYGEHHDAVWNYQHFFCSRTMRFLLLHPEHTERLQSEGDDVDCTHRLGLCAASGRYCKLEIAEVPRLSEWRVSEYDGLEEILLVGEESPGYL